MQINFELLHISKFALRQTKMGLPSNRRHAFPQETSQAVCQPRSAAAACRRLAFDIEQAQMLQHSACAGLHQAQGGKDGRSEVKKTISV